MERRVVTAKQVADNLLAVGFRPDQATELIRALSEALPASRSAVGLDDEIWGPLPSKAELESARGAADETREARLRQVLDGAFTRADAAQWLGITPQAVSKRRENHSLTAVKRGREWYFPRWQFRDDEAIGDLQKLIEKYPGTPLSLSIWATTPNPDLEGDTPADHMREHGVEPVLKVLEDARGALW